MTPPGPNLEAMRATAEAATPGLWLYGPLESAAGTWTVSLEPIRSKDGAVGAGLIAEVFSENDRDFIAAWCPTNAIAVLDMLREAESMRVFWRNNFDAAHIAFERAKGDCDALRARAEKAEARVAELTAGGGR